MNKQHLKKRDLKAIFKNSNLLKLGENNRRIISSESASAHEEHSQKSQRISESSPDCFINKVSINFIKTTRRKMEVGRDDYLIKGLRNIIEGCLRKKISKESIYRINLKTQRLVYYHKREINDSKIEEFWRRGFLHPDFSIGKNSIFEKYCFLGHIPKWASELIPNEKSNRVIHDWKVQIEFQNLSFKEIIKLLEEIQTLKSLKILKKLKNRETLEKLKNKDTEGIPKILKDRITLSNPVILPKLTTEKVFDYIEVITDLKGDPSLNLALCGLGMGFFLTLFGFEVLTVTLDREVSKILEFELNDSESPFRKIFNKTIKNPGWIEKSNNSLSIIFCFKSIHLKKEPSLFLITLNENSRDSVSLTSIYTQRTGVKEEEIKYIIYDWFILAAWLYQWPAVISFNSSKEDKDREYCKIPILQNWNCTSDLWYQSLAVENDFVNPRVYWNTPEMWQSVISSFPRYLDLLKFDGFNDIPNMPRIDSFLFKTFVWDSLPQKHTEILSLLLGLRAWIQPSSRIDETDRDAKNSIKGLNFGIKSKDLKKHVTDWYLKAYTKHIKLYNENLPKAFDIRKGKVSSLWPTWIQYKKGQGFVSIENLYKSSQTSRLPILDQKDPQIQIVIKKDEAPRIEWEKCEIDQILDGYKYDKEQYNDFVVDESVIKQLYPFDYSQMNISKIFDLSNIIELIIASICSPKSLELDEEFFRFSLVVLHLYNFKNIVGAQRFIELAFMIMKHSKTETDIKLDDSVLKDLEDQHFGLLVEECTEFILKEEEDMQKHSFSNHRIDFINPGLQEISIDNLQNFEEPNTFAMIYMNYWSALQWLKEDLKEKMTFLGQIEIEVAKSGPISFCLLWERLMFKKTKIFGTCKNLHGFHLNCLRQIMSEGPSEGPSEDESLNHSCACPIKGWGEIEPVKIFSAKKDWKEDLWKNRKSQWKA